MSDREAAKRRAAESAVSTVEDGMTVGLGSGSTAAAAIRLLGERVADGLEVVGIPTSYQAADAARAAGVPLASLPDVDLIDITIDGADQVADGDLIKGGGASHTREKILAAASQRLAIVVDDSKVSDTLSAPVPVEALPMARGHVRGAIRDLGGAASLRTGDRKSGPVITDNGNVVLDCEYGEITDPTRLAAALAPIPGIVEHGLFVDLADEIHIGSSANVTIQRHS